MNDAKRCTTALILGLMPLAAMATGACNPVGTWVVTITSPPETFTPPISELVSFLPGGVVIYTSSDLAKITGQGTWKRRPNCWIEFKLLKHIHDQTEIDFLGFIRSTVRAKIDGNSYSSAPGDTRIEIVFGMDPDAPPVSSVEVSATSAGKRLKTNGS